MLMTSHPLGIAASRQGGATSRFSRAIGVIVRTAMMWTERRGSRRDLAELDAHLLRDIGLTKAEAAEEAAMPFWKT